MSRNEWEKGTIIIPTAQWAGFKKSIREACAAAELHDFNLAVKLVEAVKAKNKGKRNVDWKEELDRESDRTERVSGYWGGTAYAYPFKLLAGHSHYLLRERLLALDEKSGKYKLRAPLKKDFCTINGKTTTFDAVDGTLFLDDKKHAASWSVSENNHAVDDARDSFVGSLFFKLLDKVQWGRNSGGAIIGNNEYNRDAGREAAGYGGSYIAISFGPLGEKERAFAEPCLFRAKRKAAKKPSAAVKR